MLFGAFVRSLSSFSLTDGKVQISAEGLTGDEVCIGCIVAHMVLVAGGGNGTRHGRTELSSAADSHRSRSRPILIIIVIAIVLKL